MHDDLTSRLIYGCGRLTGGASEREAIALVDTCLEAGLRRFDVAPYYGLGTAEQVLGTALRDVHDATITTKVGLPSPPYSLLRSYLRKAKRVLTNRQPPPPMLYVPRPAPYRSPIAQFRPNEMFRSVERSRRLLYRSRLDNVFLHESFAGDFGSAVAKTLADFLQKGYAGRIGYSNGAVFDAATDAAFPENYVAQAAIPPEFFRADWRPPSSRDTVFHSIANTGFFLKQSDPHFVQGLTRAGKIVAPLGLNSQSREVAIFFALAASRAPESGLILSSADSGRLKGLLDALHVIAQDNLATMIAGCFTA